MQCTGARAIDGRWDGDASVQTFGRDIRWCPGCLSAFLLEQAAELGPAGGE